MGVPSLMAELLLSGFFAVACFKGRAEAPNLAIGVTPRNLFGLTNRLERLRRSRWQWFAMILLLIVMRMQMGAPMMAELTVLVQFIVFLMLPTLNPAVGGVRRA